MELIDTHCHIYYNKFDIDLNQVLDRAQENNVKKLICVGVDIDSSIKALKLAEQHDMIYASAGYHPHESKDTSKYYLKELEELLQHEKVVALGEIGLDFHYNHSDKETQLKVFKEQLELANSLNIPTIVHCRKSDDDLIKSIKETKSNNGVVHCFSSNISFANNLLILSCSIYAFYTYTKVRVNYKFYIFHQF